MRSLKRGPPEQGKIKYERGALGCGSDFLWRAGRLGRVAKSSTLSAAGLWGRG